MNDLEMPDDLSCRCAKCDYGVGVAIVAGPLTAEIVGTWTPGWNEHQIARGISCDDGPCVRCAGSEPHCAAPGSPAGIGRIARYGIPRPPHGAGSRIICSNLSARRVRAIVVGD